jgi:hypothetical protein
MTRRVTENLPDPRRKVCTVPFCTDRHPNFGIGRQWYCLTHLPAEDRTWDKKGEAA